MRVVLAARVQKCLQKGEAMNRNLRLERAVKSTPLRAFNIATPASGISLGFGKYFI
jgi:hypothetical protein